MASKSARIGDKRKASTTEKSKSTNPSKKPRVKSSRQPFQAEGSSEDDNVKGFAPLSDDEDEDEGGARVNPDRAERIKGLERAKKADDNANGDGKPAATSKESHALQKQLAQERKAAKPLADELARTKKLWERLRRKSHVPKEERHTLVEELFGIVTGRIKDFVLKHDAVRVVQTAIKYATPDRRKQIARELKGTYVQLAESRYAKFLIGKLLVQNEDEIRDLIVPEFYGKVRKLINHPEASWILDDVYRGVATKEQKAILLREWYGTEFVLFDATAEGTQVDGDLRKILEKEPSKKGPIMKYLFSTINTLIQKQMTGFTILHDAMLQYFLSLKLDSEEQKEFIELVKGDEGGDLLKNMAFTKSGARLACLLLAHGSAKDRKQILKMYKDTFQLMSGDQHAHTVILTAYDVIDDTVLTSKSIFPELFGKGEDQEAENVVAAANNVNARTTILYPFEGPHKSLFPPSHKADLDLLKDVHKVRKFTSKKDAEVRRKELITAMSPPLLRVIASSAKDLVSTSFGCLLVTEVLLSAVGDKTEALAAIASTAEGDPSQERESMEEYPSAKPHPAQDPFAARMLKTLVSGGRFDRALGKVKLVDPPLNFADTLYEVIKEHVVAWATGPGSFVPMALLEAEGFSHVAELTKALRKKKALLEKAAAEETAEQKAKREALAAEAGSDEAAQAKSRKKKGGKKGPAEQERLLVGNAGAKLLLEKL
ncbi:hypothetical protein RB595_009256 [Gaeumannomyces hyphopodioides]